MNENPGGNIGVFHGIFPERDGKSWFDQQWGSDGWFVPDTERGYFFGWEWLAINLDNGQNMLIWRARDMVEAAWASCATTWRRRRCAHCCACWSRACLRKNQRLEGAAHPAKRRLSGGF